MEPIPKSGLQPPHEIARIFFDTKPKIGIQPMATNFSRVTDRKSTAEATPIEFVYSTQTCPICCAGKCA